MPRIADALGGRRIAITGTTGFLGTALLERLLRSVPEADIVLLLRAGRRSTVQQRASREIFRNDAFDRLREQLGGKAAFDEMLARRVTVVPGDVGRDGLGLDRRRPRRVRFVRSRRSTAPRPSRSTRRSTAAVEVNLLGPTRIATTLTNSLSSERLRRHLVAVSTCYVAGNRRGAAPEQLLCESPFFLDIDWRTEVDAARRARADAEADSRTPELLAASASRLGASWAPRVSRCWRRRPSSGARNG